MGLRAIMVAVDYTDLLAVTLPYNRHHFEEVCVVTDVKSTIQMSEFLTGLGLDVKLYNTDAFYYGDATFNKWAALEEALDWYGRHGWLCLMDADVLWPKDMKVIQYDGSMILDWEYGMYHLKQRSGELCTPLRRMWTEWPNPPKNWGMMLGTDMWQWLDSGLVIPSEHVWKDLPVHRNINEWAGYSQIFHAEDPHLGSAPWHETNWKHAGGADSFFQRKWPRTHKVRPPFEVLHLGPAGENWMGRSAPLLDGTTPEGAAERRRKMQELWAGRRRAGPGKFDQEKLG